MSTAKLPTRSRPDDGRFRGGRLRLVEGVCHPDPPPAPSHLSKRERELFAQAWREPESTLWRRSDAARVARWAHLAARAETDPASWVFTQLNVLEKEQPALAKFRVGAEGRISHLERRYGLGRSRLKGPPRGSHLGVPGDPGKDDCFDNAGRRELRMKKSSAGLASPVARATLVEKRRCSGRSSLPRIVDPARVSCQSRPM
jgi:hypothetical protein